MEHGDVGEVGHACDHLEEPETLHGPLVVDDVQHIAQPARAARRRLKGQAAAAVPLYRGSVVTAQPTGPLWCSIMGAACILLLGASPSISMRPPIKMPGLESSQGHADVTSRQTMDRGHMKHRRSRNMLLT